MALNNLGYQLNRVEIAQINKYTTTENLNFEQFRELFVEKLVRDRN